MKGADMRSRFIGGLTGRLTVALVLSGSMLSGAAEAKFVCRDGYQNVQGSWLATPYCQDLQLAQVARQYGWRVSDAAIRNNPNLKRRVCASVGRDIRVQETCRTVLPDVRGRGF
jgi:hypothetical protein